MKKHTSYDAPPNKGFWKVARQKKQTVLRGSSTGVEQDDDIIVDEGSSRVNVSPNQWVDLHGKCVTQLLQLHELMEKGGISKEQYHEMQETIMNDVKKFE